MVEARIGHPSVLKILGVMSMLESPTKRLWTTPGVSYRMMVIPLLNPMNVALEGCEMPGSISESESNDSALSICFENRQQSSAC